MPLFDANGEALVTTGESSITGSSSNKAAILVAGVTPTNTASFLSVSENGHLLITGSVGVVSSVPLSIGSFSSNVTASIKIVATEITQSVTGSTFVFNNPSTSLWATGSTTVNNFPITQSVYVGGINPNAVQAITGTVDITNIASPVHQGNSGSQFWKITGSVGVTSVATPVTVSQGVGGSVPWKIDQDELQTFVVAVTGVQIGNNKNMLSIMNAQGSGIVLRLRKIQVMNVQTSNVTGITAFFSFLKIGNHSGGTIVDAIAHDSFDTTSSAVSARTNSTITGSTSTFFRMLRTSDERNTAGSLDPETFEYVFSQTFGDYSLPWKAKPITLRAGEGFAVRQTANSTAGTFDVYCMFTQEKDGL